MEGGKKVIGGGFYKGFVGEGGSETIIVWGVGTWTLIYPAHYMDKIKKTHFIELRAERRCALKIKDHGGEKTRSEWFSRGKNYLDDAKCGGDVSIIHCHKWKNPELGGRNE